MGLNNGGVRGRCCCNLASASHSGQCKKLVTLADSLKLTFLWILDSSGLISASCNSELLFGVLLESPEKLRQIKIWNRVLQKIRAQ